MRARSLLYLCAVVYASSAQEPPAQSRVIQIEQGPVRGYRDTDTGIFFFLNIPYATAPTGPNKFKPPLPPPTWTETLEAVDTGIVCPQPPSDAMDNKTMVEDCLIVNVFIPDTEEINLPVTVDVHGGGFQTGFAQMRDYRKLMSDNKFITVTLNYRLGPHGFLCLGTEDAPGNAGMKDQLAMLRWLQRNIQFFGGNPDDITIEGCSAGSAAVELLMLSKTTDGLFNKVIAGSGSAISAFAIQPNPLENAKAYARLLNFTETDDINALELFYKTASLDLLTSQSGVERPDSTFYFSPCVERAIGEEEVFLDDSPVAILKSGNFKKLPLLYGFTNMEGLLKINLFESWKQMMDDNFSEFLPSDLIFNNVTQREYVASALKDFYFENGTVSDNIMGFINYQTDLIFANPMWRSIRLRLDGGHDQIYLYEYSYTDENNPVVPDTNMRGAFHCAQIAALDLDVIEQPNVIVTDEFRRMVATLREIWRNFIITGNPVTEESSLPPWPAVGINWSPYMSLGNEVRLEGPLVEERARLWNDIYSRHYRFPVPADSTPSSNNTPYLRISYLLLTYIFIKMFFLELIRN